jgi:hypothetical protein
MRILRVVGSRDLPCGCCVGLYELYSGLTIQVVDCRGDGCAATSHRPGAVLQSVADGDDEVIVLGRGDLPPGMTPGGDAATRGATAR